MKKLEVVIGQRFGYWEVISDEVRTIEYPSQKGYQMRAVNVRCTRCNKTEAFMSLGALKSSIQCRPCRFKFGSEAHNKSYCGEFSGSFFGRIKTGAKERNLPFEVTQEFLWNLYCKQRGECALSALPIDFAPESQFGRETTASLDRINSFKGYTEDNVQWIHKAINKIKLDMDQQLFIKLCRSVTEFAALQNTLQRPYPLNEHLTDEEIEGLKFIRKHQQNQ